MAKDLAIEAIPMARRIHRCEMLDLVEDTTDREVVPPGEKNSGRKLGLSRGENNPLRADRCSSNKSGTFLLIQTDEAPFESRSSREKGPFGRVLGCRVEFCDEHLDR